MRVGDRVDAGSDRRVGVLGPTMVGSQSATPRQRALVAALALAGPEGADLDELADGVWGERPPNSARSSLQNQMTRLRRSHGDDLVTCAHGRYRLGWETDIERFDQTYEQVRTAPAGRATVDALRPALLLWRGSPYSDLVDSHGAEVERARLAQIRAQAADLLAVGRLAIGDLAPCIVDLRAEVEADPYRDRAWELLLVALQRAGRTGEAMAVHQDHVVWLQEQLGAEPNPRLMEIGRALRGEVSLDLAIGDVPARPQESARCASDPRNRRCRMRGQRRPRRVDP